MATYLSGSQDLARECQLAQTPGAVTGQTGELLNIVSWYRDAWTELQLETDWRWMRHGFTFTTTANIDSYAYTDCTDTTDSAVISRFGKWELDDDDDPPHIYLQSGGVGVESYLSWIPWEYFKQIYRFGTQTASHPQHITIDPQDNIVIGPKPNDTYVITSEYYRSPQILAADADTPEMPSQYHRLIVYRAMEHYGYAEVAAEVIERARRKGARMLNDLLNNQGPIYRMAGPLV